MPTKKLQKSVNLSPEAHERAQRCADIITKQSREKLEDPNHPEFPLRLAVERALELLEEALTGKPVEKPWE
jgi:hypothetical protein